MIYTCALIPAASVCAPYMMPESYNVMSGVLRKPLEEKEAIEREIQQGSGFLNRKITTVYKHIKVNTPTKML